MVEKQGTILIVDDDPDMRLMLELALNDAGYATNQAGSGESALALIAREMPALILLDLRMQGMDGQEFAALFHSKYGHQVPILVMTAAQDGSTKAAEVDVEGYLAKPFDLDDLLRAIAAHLSPPVPS